MVKNDRKCRPLSSLLLLSAFISALFFTIGIKNSNAALLVSCDGTTSATTTVQAFAITFSLSPAYTVNTVSAELWGSGTGQWILRENNNSGLQIATSTIVGLTIGGDGVFVPANFVPPILTSTTTIHYSFSTLSGTIYRHTFTSAGTCAGADSTQAGNARVKVYNTQPIQNLVVFTRLPQDGGTINDFNYFQTRIGGYSGSGKVCVAYSTSTTDFNHLDCQDFDNASGSLDFYQAVKKNSNLSEGTWYQYTQLYDNNGNLIQSGSITSFTITNDDISTASNSLAPPEECSFTSLGSCFGTFMRWLFEPSQDEMNKWSALTLADKFPFSYWFSLKTAIDSATASSASSSFPTLSLQMPSINGHASSTFTFFSGSSLINMMGQSAFDLFRGLLVAFFWLAFGYYVYTRGREIL